jgi:hypothetical protein
MDKGKIADRILIGVGGLFSLIIIIFAIIAFLIPVLFIFQMFMQGVGK